MMIEFAKRQLISILLSTSIVIAVLSIYASSITIVLISVIIFNSLIFYFLEYVKNDEQKGMISYFVVFIFLVVVLFFIINSNGGMEDFVRELKYSLISKQYFLLVFLWACFGSSSVIFYFTDVLHKFVAPFLLLFIPSILYTTHEIDMPVIYSVLMIIFFFGNIIVCSKNAIIKKIQYISDSSYDFMVFATIFAMFILAFFVPKPNETPYKIIDKFQDKYVTEINLTDHYDSSGKNMGIDEGAAKILFEVQANEPLYLKRQVFGDYNGSLWSRPKGVQLSMGQSDWEKDAENMNINTFIEMIKLASEINNDFAQKYNIDINNLPIIEMETKTIQLKHVNFPTTYIPNPLGIFEIEGLPPDFDYYRTPLGEIITANRVYANQQYSISYMDDNIDVNPQVMEFLKDFDHDKYNSILYDLKSIFASSADEKNYNISSLLLEELEKADYYKSQNSYEIPLSIEKIANTIIEGKTSDYEKALAIESYFHESDYLYDLKYKAPPRHDNIEYFIFESKTGTCSDYATAMTLMARSVGLNVRYVEGFYTGEENELGVYTVATKNSHAYPEVFLHGYGWKVFEPTVSASNSNVEIGKSEITRFFGIVFTVFFGVFLINRYIVPILREILFRRKVKSSSKETGIILIYSKILKMIVLYGTETSDSFTPQILTEYVFKNYSINIKSISDLFEKIAFNNDEITKDELYSALSIYINFYEIIKKINT